MSRSRTSFLPLCVAGVALLAAGTAFAGPGKARKVTPKQLSADIVVVEGEAYVPLADLANATGCKLTKPKASKFYEAWPCKPGGLLTLDIEALRAAQMSIPPFMSKVGVDAPGSKVAFNPQPDPPLELRFDGVLASRAVVLREGVAHLPLVEVARLMGGKVQRKGKRAYISVPVDVDAPIELAMPSPQKVAGPGVD